MSEYGTDATPSNFKYSASDGECYQDEQVHVQCCFTSTETTRTIRDREPRTVTSTLAQLLSSVTKAKCCFTSTETIRTIKDRGAQNGHLDFHTAPEF